MKNKKGNAFVGIILGIILAIILIILAKVMLNIDVIGWILNLLAKIK